MPIERITPKNVAKKARRNLNPANLGYNVPVFEAIYFQYNIVTSPNTTHIPIHAKPANSAPTDHISSSPATIKIPKNKYVIADRREPKPHPSNKNIVVSGSMLAFSCFIFY